jgi:hypothetical protein
VMEVFSIGFESKRRLSMELVNLLMVVLIQEAKRDGAYFHVNYYMNSGL